MVNREDEFPIEITRVTDGDGFEARALDGSDRTFEVRLYAIDAPEGTQKYGKEATDHLRQEVKGGRFWLEGKGTDPHGRTLAVVYKDTYDTAHTLNYLMVRTGWAYWYFEFDKGNSFGLREAEIAAYMDCKGVWQEPEVERPWTFKERMRQEAKERACQEKLRQEAEEEARREAEERERRLGLTPERARLLSEVREMQKSTARRRLAGEGARREVEEERRPLPVALTPEKERRLAYSREMQESIARQRLAEERKRR